MDSSQLLIDAAFETIAAYGFTNQGKTGEEYFWTHDESDGIISIRPQGETLAVTAWNLGSLLPSPPLEVCNVTSFKYLLDLVAEQM